MQTFEQVFGIGIASGLGLRVEAQRRALFGALLVTADLIGRWVIAPSELPIGIVTALIGAPYFAYLLYKSRN